MKKTLSLFLALIIILVAIPFSASAYGDYTDNAYEAVFNGLLEMKSAIDISKYNLTEESLKSLVSQLIANEPELFYMDSQYTQSYLNGKLVAYKPKYTMNSTELATAKAFVESELNSIVSLLPEGLDDYEKALFFYDYICVNFEYDSDLVIADVYEMLKNGEGICQAYSLLYDALLAKVGIEAMGVFCRDIAHMWNQIKIGDEWYHVDVTWGDARLKLNDGTVIDVFGRAKHTTFLQSDSAAIASHGGHAIDAKYVCDDTSFDNAAWRENSNSFGFANGETYYLGGADIKKLDIASGNTESVYTVDAVWRLPDGRYYPNQTYSGFGSCDDKLIFNSDKKIMYFDPSDSTVGVAFDPELTDDNIYKMYVSGDNAYYMTSGEYSHFGTVSDIKLSFSDSEPEPEIIYGDLSMDGKVQITDYVLLKRAFFGTYELNDSLFIRADINKNDTIDITDYVLCKRIFFGTYSVKN